MASLKSLIHDGKFFAIKGTPHQLERISQLVKEVQLRLASPNTILVNAQAVWDDLDPWSKPNFDEARKRLLDFKSVPRPKPPYREMWLEATRAKIVDPRGILEPMRKGMLVRRIEVPPQELESLLKSGLHQLDSTVVDWLRRDSPATIIFVNGWYELEGQVVFDQEFLYWLDADGNYIEAYFRDTSDRGSENFKNEVIIFSLNLSWVLHSFARMNCHNVQLIPIASGKQKNLEHPNRPPFSVWHEIKVTSVTALRKQMAAGKTTDDGEKREVRFHWVRGHYADYRKGAGLFGNPKLRGLFYISEHPAGEEELGTVVSRYTVTGR